jgi:hypothetical protein
VFDKVSIARFKRGNQHFRVVFSQKHEARLNPATFGAAGTGKAKPLSIKRHFGRHKDNFYPKTFIFTSACVEDA